MEKYSKYKDSGVEWIGEIPKHWDMCRLKSYCTLKGRIGWNGLRSEEFKETSYAYLVTGQDFNSASIQWDECYQIDKDRYEEDPFIQLNEGDLLITKDGTIGKIAKVSNLDKPACLNSGIFVMKQRNIKFDQGFLYWLLCSNILKDFNAYTSSGTTILHLYQNVFERMPMPIPTINEQQSIAKYLDSKCSKIDHVIATQQKRVELLKELKQSIITRAVTRGINPNAKMKDSGVEWIGEIPEHWEIMKLKRVLSNFQDGSHESFSRVDSDFPLLSAKNVYENGIVFSEEDSTISEEDYKSIVSNGFPQKGDVTLCCVGTIGRCCIYDLDEPMAFQRSVTFLRVNDFVLNQFLLYLLRSRVSDAQYTMYAKTSAQSGIYMNTLVNFNIVVPDVDEQCEIVAFIEWKCSVIDSQLSKINRQIELLQELKQSIITEVVTGKRKVC